MLRFPPPGMALACCLLAAPAPAGPPPIDPLVPGSVAVLAVVHLRPALAAPLVRKYALEELTRLLGRDDRVVKVLRLAGLDPLRDVDTFTFAASGDLPSPRLLGIIRGRFDPAKMHAAAEEHAKQYPDKIKISKEGERVLYQVQAEKAFFAAFADRGTLVLSPSREHLLEVLKRAAETPAPLNNDMRKALEKLDGRECAWAAGVITAPMKQALRQQDPDLGALTAALESVTGRLELTDALHLAIVIHAANAEAAGLVRRKLDEVLPLLNFLAPGKDTVGRVAKEAVSSIKVATEKNDVRITLQLTEAMIQKAGKKEQP